MEHSDWKTDGFEGPSQSRVYFEMVIKPYLPILSREKGLYSKSGRCEVEERWVCP